MKDLFPLWCEQCEQDWRKQATAADDAYEQLKNKNTLYAESIRTIAALHHRAANIYRNARLLDAAMIDPTITEEEWEER